VVGLHVLLATAHVVLRVAERNPEAECRGAVLDDARFKFHGHDRRAIAHTHLPIGPPFDIEGPAEAEVSYRARLVPLIDDAVDLDLLTVAVRDRQQVAQQEESGGLIRQLQGCNLTRLEAGIGAHLRINGSAQRASELLLGLLRLLLALDRKLIQCTQGASFGDASTPGLITYSVPRAASRYYLKST
jgi:hypothetical protein